MRELTVRAEVEAGTTFSPADVGRALSRAMREVVRVKHLEVLDVTSCGQPYPDCTCPDQETYEEDNRA